jgi:hypothetical protein
VTPAIPLGRNRWKSMYGFDKGVMNQVWIGLNRPIDLWTRIAWMAGGRLCNDVPRVVHLNCRQET